MFGRGFDVNFSLIFSVLRNLEIIQRDGAVFEQILGSFELGVCEDLISNCFPIVGECTRHIVASHGQQQLTFFNGVAQPSMDAYDTTRRE